MSSIRIAMAQINAVVGDIGGNTERIKDALAQAREQQADLASVPELAICGEIPEDLLLKPQFVRECRKALSEIIKQVKDMAAVVVFPEEPEGGHQGWVYNTAALIHDQQIKGLYRKIELPNYGVFDEKRYFRPGGDSLVVEIRGVRVMITICEDLWIKGEAAEKHAHRNKPDIIFNPAASPFNTGKLYLRMQTLEGFAVRTRSIMCYNTMVGAQDGVVFDGGSLVMDPAGEIITSLPRFEEGMLVADLDVDRIFQNAGLARKQKPSVTATVSIDAPDYGERRPVQQVRARELSETEEVHMALTLGTRDYISKNGFNKATVGLSGGVDSSLVAAVSAEALGAENVIGVLMPSRFTSQESLDGAQRLADNLGIQTMNISIEPAFEAYKKTLEEAFQGGEPGVELENIQARIRGNILMALSNRFGWMVLATGNRSENAMGYATLYGDMAGGFAPIKDVPKTQVYELCRYVNRRAGKELIPDSVIQRLPTAELKPGQKDEDTLPPYPVLDGIIRLYMEEDLPADEIISRGYDLPVVEEVVSRLDRNEYKRRQGPPGVKISPRSFIRDWRMPITNLYRPRTGKDGK